VRIVGWLLVLGSVFALGFSVRVVSAGASVDTQAAGLVGVVASMIVLGVGAAVVAMSRSR
jgi:hypothetical protein